MDEALSGLSSYFPIFYTAFEEGIAHAKNYFDERNDPYDRHLYAHLVRYWVKKYLNQHGLNAEYEGEDLTNSGIQLTIKTWFIRMLKSSKGAMPAPGHSKKLQKYYQQVLPGDFSYMHNLLLLWHTTHVGEFTGLSLVYPFSASVVKWRAEIPHPATSAHIKTILQPKLDWMDETEVSGNLEIEPLIDENESENDSEAENQ